MKKYLILLFIPALVFGFGSQTVKQIDEIKNNTGTDILLNPTDKVDINYFTGEKALQSTVDGELEESAVTNTELGYLSGVTSSIQSQIDSKTPLSRLINTTSPLQGGGDLTADRTLSITQGTTSTDGYITSADWNTFNNKQDALTGTDGDLYYWNSGLSNLGIGTNGQVLSVSALGFPEWIDLPPSVSVTTKGDLQTYSTSPDRLPVGTNGQVLSANSATSTGLEWIAPPVSYVSPTTTEGDLIINDGGGAGSDTRLGIGTNGQLLTSNGTTASWQDPPVTLPDQTGNAGLYLTTNGSTASWNEVNRDVNEIKDNLLECAGFDACAPEGTITNGGSAIDFSGTTTRTLEVAAYNTSKLNLNQSAAETLDYTYTKTANFDGKTMVAYCEIKNNSGANGVTFSVGANGTEQGSLDVSTEAKWKYYKIPFVGGDTSQYFSINHSDTGTIPDIDVDNCFIGKASNITREIGSAHFVGSLTYDSPNCQWNSTSVSYSDFPIDSDCVASNISGSIQSPDTALPAIKIPNIRTDGYYDVRFNGLLYASTTTECRFSISSSSNYENQGDLWVKGVDTSNIHQNRATTSANGSFRFSDTGDKTLRIISYRVTGTGNCSVYGNSIGDLSAKFTVHFYPDDTSTIVTQDTELTAKTANRITTSFDSAGSVLKEDYAGAITFTSYTSGAYLLDYSSLNLTEVPSFHVTGNSNSNNDFTFHTRSATTSTVIVRSYENGTANVGGFDITLIKQGADVNKSATIVGKFENINSSDLLKVEASGNGGETIVTSSTNITWSIESIDNYNAWNGSFFTAPKDSWYVFSGTARYTTNASRLMGLVKNGTNINQYCGGSTFASGYFTCYIYLLKNETASMREYASGGTLNNVPDHKIYITELPDTESIIKNLSNQKVECTRKYLTANATTTGVMSDLTFNNLEIGKKYQVFGKIRQGDATTATNEKYAAMNIWNGSGANRIDTFYSRGLNLSRHQSTWMPTTLFTAVDTILTFDNAVLTNTILVGDGTPSNTYVDLCELPDSTILNSDKFN
jgi:hypothetical protein